MIKDPYIGMPIVIGRRQASCDSCGNSSINPSDNRSQSGMAMGCGPLGDVPQLNWQGGSAGKASGFDAMYLGSLPLASAYIPYQQWKTTYTLEGALQRGTIFPELDLPFEGGMRR